MGFAHIDTALCTTLSQTVTAVAMSRRMTLLLLASCMLVQYADGRVPLFQQASSVVGGMLLHGPCRQGLRKGLSAPVLGSSRAGFGGLRAAFASAGEGTADIRANLDAVNGAITKLCTQIDRSPPRLVAVSKIQPNAAIKAAYDAGHRHFGENYVQEIVGKAPELPKDINWHFIGALQSNKAKSLVQGVESLWMVESVHTQKCASALDKACAAAARQNKLKVLVQVNTSEEDSKSGCTPEEALDLSKHIVEQCENLELAGLMTIGKFGDPNPEPYFRLLSECRGMVSKALGIDENALELSMGMSGDFEKAIKAGSTNVRVGTTVFGARPPKAATGSS